MPAWPAPAPTWAQVTDWCYSLSHMHCAHRASTWAHASASASCNSVARVPCFTCQRAACFQHAMQAATVSIFLASSCTIVWQPRGASHDLSHGKDRSCSYQAELSCRLPSGPLACSSLRLPLAALARLAAARQLVPTQFSAQLLSAPCVHWQVGVAPLSHILVFQKLHGHAWLQGCAQQPRSPYRCLSPTW